MKITVTINLQLAKEEPLPAEVREQVYMNRWANLQIDGTIAAIDEGIGAMIQLAAVVTHGHVADGVEDPLDDLEGASLATTLKLRQAFTLHPRRTAHVLLDVPSFLVEAVGQYIANMHHAAADAIVAGARQAMSCGPHTLTSDALFEAERGYVEWVVPRVVSHLVYAPCECYEGGDSARGYFPRPHNS